MQPITVYRSFSAADAQLIRSRLEASGFSALVTHELASLSMEGYSMSTGGILVQVSDDQADEAKELISSMQATNE